MKLKTLILVLTLLTSAALEAGAQQYNTAREVLEANIEATGGQAAWNQIRTTKRVGTRQMNTPMGERTINFQEHYRYPGFSRVEDKIHSPMGEMIQLVVRTPDGGWTDTMMGNRDLPVDSWPGGKGEKDEIALLLDDAVTFGELETEIEDDGPVYIFTFTFEEESYKRKYSQIDLSLAEAEVRSSRGQKSAVQFSDYREVEGVMIPFAWDAEARIQISGGPGGGHSDSIIVISSVLESISFNEELSDSLFSK